MNRRPPAYCKLRDGAEHLSTSLRFRTGSAELDTRASQDLRRVLDRRERWPDKAIALTGFADSSGAYTGTCALARTRAERGGRAEAAGPERFQGAGLLRRVARAR